MDLIALIQSIPGIGPVIPYLALACTIAAIICTMIPAPKTTSGAYYVLYQIINTLAANVGHAKSLSAPESTGIVGGAGAVSAPLIATGTVPLASATVAQKAVTVVPGAAT